LANMIDIVVNATDRASKTIKGINKSLQGMADRAERASAVTNTALGGLAVAFAGVAMAGVAQNKVMEESDARWTTLLKSSEKAEKQMKWMKDFAKTTPFDYKAIDETATALTGMGLGIKDVNKWLPTLGDASAVLGGGSETVKGLGMALGQMNAKGKVSAEEMQQLAERGVNAWQMLADGMGMTQAEVRKLSEDGKLLAKDALPLIYEGMQKTFGGGTQNLMKSTSGQAMLARENFNLLSGAIMKGAYDYFGAYVLPLINKGMEKLTSIFEGGLLSGFQKMWNSSEKARLILVAMGGALLSVLIPAFIGLVSAIAPAVVAFAPFLAIGMAVAGLAYLIYDNWSILAPYFQTLWDKLTGAFEVAKNLLADGWNWLIGVWNNNKPTIIQWLKDAWVDIQTAFETAKNLLSTGWTWLVGVWDNNKPAVFDLLKTAWDTMKTAFETVKNLLAEGWNWLVGIWESKGESAKGIFDGIKKVWDTLKNAFEIALPIIISVIEMIWSNIQILWSYVSPILNDLKDLWNTLKDAFEAIKPTIMTLVTIIGAILVTAFVTAIGIINGVIRAIAPLIQAVISVIEFIINLGMAVIKVFQGDFDGAFKFAKKAFNNLLETIAHIIEAIIQFFIGFVQGVWSIIRPWATDMWNKFKEMMTNAKDAVVEGASKMIAKIVEFVADMISKAVELKDDFKAKVVETMTGAVSAITDGIGDMISEAGSWVSDFVQSGKDLIGGFIDGIAEKGKDIAGALGGALSKARNLLPFSPAKEGPLSDLDKSGASFFPTFAQGMAKKVRPMLKVARKGFSELQGTMSKPVANMEKLDNFTFGKQRQTLTLELKVSGDVGVNGDKEKYSKEYTEQVTGGVDDVINGLRQAIRKR
jgi:tape measure domain-containing protein